MADHKEHKMDVVSEGLLDEISKPPSAGSRGNRRAGDRAASRDNRGSAVRRSKTPLSGGLQFLTPEEIMRHEFDLELEECGSSQSDYTDEDDGKSNINTVRTSEIFNIAEPLPDQPLRNNLGQTQEETEEDKYLASRQLSLYTSLGDNTELTVDSDEERSIIREIRDEITKQVREEMKDEIEVYQYKRDKLESRGEGEPDKKEQAEEMDPKLKQAILKMKKLDRILAKKIKKEKSVKRDRILLQRRLKEELDNLKTEGKEESREVKSNTEKFLALALPPSHNAGVSLIDAEEDENEDLPPVTPVFQTQVLEDMLNSENKNASSLQDGMSSVGSDTPHGSQTSATSLGNSTSLGGSTGSRQSGGRHKKNDKDFIKRNMQLAADAGNAIAMTDDEKKRIEDLLGDLEALPEIPEDQEQSVSGETPNPFQVALLPGDGFMPDRDEQHALEDIDNRLRALLPAEDFESIASMTPRSVASHHTQLFTRTALLSDNMEDLPGEKPLLENKEQRDLQRKLKDIESELERLTSAVEMEMEDPHLSNDQLQDLLEQCARTISRTTAETDSLSSRSSVVMSRQSLIENPPKLPDDVLQKLLQDAREELAISAPPTGRSDDSSEDNKDEVDEVVLKSISEEHLKQLLQDSRTTSRAMASRSGSRASSAGGTTWPRPPDGAVENGYYDHYNGSGMSDAEKLAGRIPSRVYNMQESYEDRRPFLPEIDPKGVLSTAKQGGVRLNNEDSSARRPPSTSLLSAVTVRNSFTPPNQGVVYQSFESETDPVPRPPSSGRRTNSAGKHRSSSKMSRNSFDD